eukprot:m.884087 g.884087  ORF g.884087 m.884087 type:complete len:162 (-) comp23613_c0_seq13:2931-3416(-)
MTSCVVLYRVSFCTVPHPFHNQALALGEDIDRKKQAAIAEVKAEKLNLDSQRLELHVHTLREPPRDSVAYNEWKIATEGAHTGNTHVFSHVGNTHTLTLTTSTKMAKGIDSECNCHTTRFMTIDCTTTHNLCGSTAALKNIDTVLSVGCLGDTCTGYRIPV